MQLIKNKSGPNIEPCDTPAFTGNQSDFWSLSRHVDIYDPKNFDEGAIRNLESRKI